MGAPSEIIGTPVTTESFYIGTPGHRCYCTLDEPNTRLIRDAGVVMCYPAGHEYFRAHRSFSRIARELAGNGFSVLRFDFRGTGDSEADVSNLRLRDWINDIERASEALLDRVPVSKLVLLGMRLGASLAVKAAARIGSLETLVLWDLISDGERYCRDLCNLHTRMLRDLERFRRPRPPAPPSEEAVEIFGTRYSPAIFEEIGSINANNFSETEALDVLLINSRSSQRTHRELVNGFASNACVSQHTLNTSYSWNDARRAEEIIIDTEATREIVTALQVIHR